MATQTKTKREPTFDDAAQNDVHSRLMHEQQGEAHAALVASGVTIEDATEATEAETPPENIQHISDATLPKRKIPA